MTELFSYGPGSIGKFFKKNIIAILYTIILHLIVAIVLVFLKVEGLKEDRELGVMLDFTEEISFEELLEQENIEVPPEWIEQVFERREQASNRAVNLNDEINQEISTEEYVEQLLAELEDQKDEDFINNRERLKEIISSKVYEKEAQPQQKNEQEDLPFTGPTTITYEFSIAPKERSSRFLTVPVYKCEGSGLVIVEIEVRNNGTVSTAKTIRVEAGDNAECFIQAAENAAKSSTFDVDFNAPEKHTARISYQFIAQ